MQRSADHICGVSLGQGLGARLGGDVL